VKFLRLSVSVLLVSSLNYAQQTPTIGGCPIFPANNIWNTPVDSMPVHPRSADYITNIGPGGGIRYDTTMPINVAPSSQPPVAINESYPPESDPGPFPIPANAQVEPGDLHVLVVDQSSPCVLYETYNSVLQPNGSWNVDAAAKWDLTSNALRPDGWTSADGAGLPITPGVLRYAEMISGHINHALRMSVPSTQADNYQWPARHYASHDTWTALPMMGQRFRLKAGLDISSYSANMQVVLTALKKYGAMVADNGLAWSLQADTDARWDPNDLQTLRNVVGSNWEAVDVSGLMIDPNSGEARQPGSGTAVSSVTVSPATVVGGFNVPVTVTLSGAAPASGALVTLTGSTPAFPTTTVLVGAGLSSQTFSVPTASVASTNSVIVTAAYNGAAVNASMVSITAPLANSCPTFPADNIWNTPVNTLPVSSNSANYVNSISATGGIRYDTTMPFNLVPGTQPLVPIHITYPSESDPGPYPIPPNAQVEAGDLHVLTIDTGDCELYETYNSVENADGSWNVDSGAKWSLTSDALRPAGWTSGDGAGLPIYAGLLRYAEMASGQINHALRFTAPSTQAAYVWPARHLASSNNSTVLPPMGQRFRLKAGYDISGFSANMQVILRALKTYGMMLADNGLPWSLQGDTDPRWDANDLLTLRQVSGSNFEAVDATTLMVDPNSGQALQAGGSTAPPPTLPPSSGMPDLYAVTVSPGSVAGGSNVNVTVWLTAAAPSAGVPVTLSAASPAFPAAQVTVAAGLTQQTFSLPTAGVSTQTTISVILSAAFTSSQKAAALTLTPGSAASSAPKVVTLALSSNSVTGGSGVTATVTLSGAASGNVAVNLTSSSSAVSGVTLTIPAGASSGSINLSSSAVTASTTTTVTASANGGAASASLTVNPPGSSTSGMPDLYAVTVSPTSVTGGSMVNVTVWLTGAAPGSGVPVTLTATGPAFPTAQVTVSASLTQQTFSLPTAAVSASATVMVIASASYTKTQKGANLTVTPGSTSASVGMPDIYAVTVPATSVAGGSSVNVTVWLTGAAPAGGAPVTLKATGAAFPTAQVTVPAGLTQQTFSLPTAAVSAPTSVMVIASASYTATQKGANLTITP
jgi:hypothetical protein